MTAAAVINPIGLDVGCSALDGTPRQTQDTRQVAHRHGMRSAALAGELPHRIGRIAAAMDPIRWKGRQPSHRAGGAAQTRSVYL
jgi:hypothetical protein